MKLHVFIAACALATAGLCSCTSETISHDASGLPAKVRDTVARNFTSAISLIETEKSMGSVKEYEVTLTDGSEISFDGDGEWKSVDTPTNVPVPEGLVPTAIGKYVAEKHAGAFIVGIERNKKGYEIELSNDIEMQFDAAGNFMSYDK